MPNDPTLIVAALLLLGIVGFLLLAGIRAVKIERTMVSGVFRSRARWNGTFAFLFIPFTISVSYLYNLSTVPANWLGNPLTEALSLFVVVFNLAAFVFLDRIIMTAREMDFFHRDTFRYGIARKVIWPISIIGMLGTFLGPSTGLLSLTFSFLWPGPLPYYAAALALTSLRVSDRYIRSYSKWTGLAAAAIGATFLYQVSAGGGEISFLVGAMVVAGLFYRATESLSPISHLETNLAGLGRKTAIRTSSA